MNTHRFDHKKFRVKEGDTLRLSKIATKAGDELDGKNQGLDALEQDLVQLQEAQERLFASGQRLVWLSLVRRHAPVDPDPHHRPRCPPTFGPDGRRRVEAPRAGP